MDTVLTELEFFTQSGIIGISKKGALTRKYIYALLGSNIEFNENSRKVINNFLNEIKCIGKAGKNYRSLCRNLIEERSTSQQIIETLRGNFEEFSFRINQLTENVDDFILENHLTVHLENESNTVSITKENQGEMDSEQLHEQSSAEQAASEKSCSEELSEQLHEQSSVEKAVSENPTCSEFPCTESLAVSDFSDKNLLADYILCEIGFPLYSNKKGFNLKKFSHTYNYTSVITQPEFKITVTKAPSGKYKVFLGVSCDLNLSFSNTKKVPFEKQNRINLRVKNTTVKAYCSLDAPPSQVSVSIGQMFQVNNHRGGISGNFTFKEKKFQPQNFSFQTQVMTEPIVKNGKSNTCCMVTPNLSFEFFPFLHENTMKNINTSKKPNTLLVQGENRTAIGLEAENSVSEITTHQLETEFSQPLTTMVMKSQEYEIFPESIDSMTVQNKFQQGVGVDPNPPSHVSIQHKHNNMFRVGFFGVALILAYTCMRYVTKGFWRKNS